MAFDDDMPLPKRIELHASGGPSFRTRVVQVESGHEFRDELWANALRTYDFRYITGDAEKQELLNEFFHAHRGQAVGFRAWDPLDHSATADQGVFIEIDATHYQLGKLYQAGTASHIRTIAKPIAEVTFVVGSPPGTYTLDYDTGIVTVAGGGGPPDSWAGQFHVPVRFNTDSMPRSIVDGRGDGESYIVDWSEIQIVETRDIA